MIKNIIYKKETLKTFCVCFGENSTHEDVIKQVIEGLVKNKFAKKREIIEMWENTSVFCK